MFNDEDPSLFQALGAKYKAYKHELVATAKVKMIEADLKVQQAQASYLRHQYACQIEFISAQNKIQKLQLEQHAISMLTHCTSPDQLTSVIRLLSEDTKAALGIAPPALPAPPAPRPVQQALPAVAAKSLSAEDLKSRTSAILRWVEANNIWNLDKITARFRHLLVPMHGESGADQVLSAVARVVGDWENR